MPHKNRIIIHYLRRHVHAVFSLLIIIISLLVAFNTYTTIILLCVQNDVYVEKIALQNKVWWTFDSTGCIPEARKMLYSPDTDVYNIGLPIIQQHSSLEVYIESKGRRSDTHRYLDVNKYELLA